MNTSLLGILIVLAMLTGTICTLELGRRFGVRRMARDPEGAKAGGSAVSGAVAGLMGLLIAFTFSGSASRLDTRRTQIVEEANCIGTAWLRLDLLPAAAQPPLRETFRQYTDARYTAFRKLPDLLAAQAELDRATVLQNEIWTQAVAACRDSGSPQATMLLLPAVNQMFDAATVRTMGTRMHPPWIIYAILMLLVLGSSLLAGYHMGEGKSRSWFHSLAFVAIMTLVVYVILDFEFPRMGLIRISNFDQVFVELRQSMK